MKIQPPVTLRDIFEMSEETLMIGNPKLIISGINEIHKVEEGDITYVDHPKYYDKVIKSKARAIIINKEVPCPPGKAIIITDDPFGAYIKLVLKYRSFEPCVKTISDSAVIGEGTCIQPNAFIGNHVVIGKNCIIHANASIYDYSVIGDNVIIHSNSVIGADAYYYKRKPAGYDKMESCGRTVIEDNVEIGALTSVDKGVSGDTIIGKGTKIDNHVQIGHDCVIGKNVLIGSHCAIGGVSEIHDDVILWARVSVNKDIVIGKGAVILALSGVDKSLEGGKTYWGIPVGEVRRKWKETAVARRLPEIEDKLKSRGVL
jgi:UDP-3-O-[3-hydroxymyristoyl] glucosamine N-acyltransferase